MNDLKSSIAVIITCHNRKEKTLQALANLMTQKGIDNFETRVYLVDDGSSDGTMIAIKNQFPKVKIIHGDGTLFWNGGMRVAFSEAMKSNPDYYLWLNDDTFLYEDALLRLLETYTNLTKENKNEVIVTGSVIDPESGKTNYGGRRQKGRLHPINFLLVEKNNDPQPCDTFNGNVVLIPSHVALQIGNISTEFSKQHNGDIDYGLRAKYAGFESWVAPGVLGECSSNSISGTIFDRSLTLKERIRLMKSHKGVPPAKEWMIFTKRHGGYLWPYYWIRTIIRVIFPFTYLFIRRPKS